MSAKRPKNQTSMRMLGKQVAAARGAVGLTQRELALRVRIDDQTIASIEQGRRTLKLDLAERLDEALDTKGTLAAGVANLPEIDRYPLFAEQFVDHEGEAIAISWYECISVPGLLQTPGYVRAMFRNRVPAFSEDEIEAKTEGRLARQEILRRASPPTLSFVVWEPAIHVQVGGTEVRRAQLRHLRELSELPYLTLQLLPMGTPSHAGLAGPFIILETPDHQHLAYAESQIGSHWIADPDDVSDRMHKYAMLRSQALNPKESQLELDRLLGEG
ncbi:MAG: helix-turn-helix transcriptional regulator [Streptomyces sp.]|jgi:transcriptional regulator with XRE-family HTH domain|uniref:helix-turn-helix domain-containing protein n=1 Tax=Streptomyces sp. TaxID=1931 RepID=UPI0025DE1770|nr:helix-turn-helix transcriptional regulator [Streptomyces sp.]MBW8798124.1 helix-turn-helix transcriptional regulator [Streptomyces sp.]